MASTQTAQFPPADAAAADADPGRFAEQAVDAQPELGDAEHFDLIIIGAGSGNTIIDERFDDRRIALIDPGSGTRGSFGGTCLNVGCIPTKMMVLPADYAVAPSEARRIGVDLVDQGADFEAIRDRIFARIDPIADHGLAWREKSGNVTVLRSTARFLDAHRLQVGQQQITGDQIVIAAGSRPRLLDVPGSADPDLAALLHTSDSIMRIAQLPQRLVIIGGGIEAVEFAHIFSGLGSQVTLLHRSPRLLRNSDQQVAETLLQELSQRMVIRLNQQVSAVSARAKGGLEVTTTDRDGVEYSYPADAVLVCIGRVPNGDLLEVQAAGVEVDPAGFVVTDAQQRTSQEHIWALGDVTSHEMLKHVANAQARAVQHNLLHPDQLVATLGAPIPAGIFTHPQIAQIGLTEDDLQALGADYVTAVVPYADTAYGWALEDTRSFCKLVADPDGKLLGAHIIGPQAATLLQPLVQMLSFGMDPLEVARGQYWPHPALTEVVENALLRLEHAVQEHRAAKSEQVKPSAGDSLRQGS